MKKRWIRRSICAASLGMLTVPTSVLAADGRVTDEQQQEQTSQRIVREVIVDGEQSEIDERVIRLDIDAGSAARGTTQSEAIVRLIGGASEDGASQEAEIIVVDGEGQVVVEGTPDESERVIRVRVNGEPTTVQEDVQIIRLSSDEPGQHRVLIQDASESDGQTMRLRVLGETGEVIEETQELEFDDSAMEELGVRILRLDGDETGASRLLRVLVEGDQEENDQPGSIQVGEYRVESDQAGPIRVSRDGRVVILNRTSDDETEIQEMRLEVDGDGELPLRIQRLIGDEGEIRLEVRRDEDVNEDDGESSPGDRYRRRIERLERDQDDEDSPGRRHSRHGRRMRIELRSDDDEHHHEDTHDGHAARIIVINRDGEGGELPLIDGFMHLDVDDAHGAWHSEDGRIIVLGGEHGSPARLNLIRGRLHAHEGEDEEQADGDERARVIQRIIRLSGDDENEFEFSFDGEGLPEEIQELMEGRLGTEIREARVEIFMDDEGNHYQWRSDEENGEDHGAIFRVEGMDELPEELRARIHERIQSHLPEGGQFMFRHGGDGEHEMEMHFELMEEAPEQLREMLHEHLQELGENHFQFEWRHEDGGAQEEEHEFSFEMEGLEDLPEEIRALIHQHLGDADEDGQIELRLNINGEEFEWQQDGEADEAATFGFSFDHENLPEEVRAMIHQHLGDSLGEGTFEFELDGDDGHGIFLLRREDGEEMSADDVQAQIAPLVTGRILGTELEAQVLESLRGLGDTSEDVEQMLYLLGADRDDHDDEDGELAEKLSELEERLERLERKLDRLLDRN